MLANTEFGTQGKWREEGRNVKGGRMDEGASGGGEGAGGEGRKRGKKVVEGEWERKRGREAHSWVVLVGGFRDVLVVVNLHKS